MAPTLFDKDPRPGDLIEIDRGAFQHWAIYVGQNEVVHLIPHTHTGSDSLGLVNFVQYLESSRAVVRCEKIWDVVGPHHYHVNNLLDDEYEPRHRRDIVREARELVGWELPYNVVLYNCEHFVTDLRYGKAKSRQVKDAVVAIGGAAVAGVAVVTLGAVLFRAFLKNDDD